MESDNYNTKEENNRSSEDCQIGCKNDPKCHYYKFNKNKLSCEHYFNQRKVCRTFLGVPKHIKKNCPPAN